MALLYYWSNLILLLIIFNIRYKFWNKYLNKKFLENHEKDWYIILIIINIKYVTNKSIFVWAYLFLKNYPRFDIVAICHTKKNKPE